MTVSLNNQTKNTTAAANQSRTMSGGLIFYAWMFWFTISSVSAPLANAARSSTSLSNQSKN
jgi:hypothetical protein